MMEDVTFDEVADFMESAFGNRNPSIAALIAYCLGNDCRTTKTVDGESIHGLCGKMTTACSRDDDGKVCYHLPDGSKMLLGPDGWEINEEERTEIGYEANDELRTDPTSSGQFPRPKVNVWCSSGAPGSNILLSYGITIRFDEKLDGD
jgi:hypothetical protein